jgi:Flp pilus assembly pilin Flp
MNRSRDRILKNLIADECGAATTEYVVVIGLVILGVVAVLLQFGPKVLARWASVGQKLGGGPGNVVAAAPGADGSNNVP